MFRLQLLQDNKLLYIFK